MALTIPCSTTAVLTVDDYLDYVNSNVDLRDLDSIAASAPMLRALANDRTLVVSKLNERIKTFMSGTGIASAQAILLGRRESFYVRASIWPALADMANARAYQDQFAYNFAHDHNFTFMTVNHLGPGYETDIYEYDYGDVEGYVGEAVDIRFLEKVRFGAGSVMLYRAGRDVHIQFPPEELTITINLMISLPEIRARDQFCFDVTKQIISGYPADLPATGRASLLNLAGLVGNGNTRQLLSDLASHHPCRRTRITAYEALCRQNPERAMEIWTDATNDKAPVVANTARRNLKELDRR